MKRVVFIAFGLLVSLTGVAAAILLMSPQAQNALFRWQIAHALGLERCDLLAPDALRVAICGSGSPMPDAARAQSCAVVFAAGRYWIIDAGPGSWDRIARWRIPHRLIGVFITHFHSDHIGALGEFNMQTWALGRTEQLAVYGGPGIERVVEGFNQAYALDRGYRMAHHGPALMPLASGPMRSVVIKAADGASLRDSASNVVFEAEGLRVTAIAVDHHPVEPAYGFRFDYVGRSVVFSGDTKRSRGLITAGQGADLLVHGAQAMDLVEIMESEAARAQQPRLRSIFADIRTYHSSLADVADVAKVAGIRSVLLTHLNPPLPSWLAERVFRRGTGDIQTTLAYDGLLVVMPQGRTEVTFSSLGR